MPTTGPKATNEEVQKRFGSVRDNIEIVIHGKRSEIDLALGCLLAGGHLLIEDVPGVGKTTLARALARSLSCCFKRIQFTPDLLPADITGMSVFDPKTQEFVFKPGPLITNVLLADEINRTTPRTQSALLEAMNDLQVTVDGVSHALRRPFMVIATQNPLEFAGTFPLPESQLDRFLIRMRIGYPSPQSEEELLRRRKTEDPLEGLGAVLSAEQVRDAQEATKEVRVGGAIIEYILRIVGRTRTEKSFQTGASPRGALFLHRAAQAHALLAGRDYVIPDDVKQMAVPTLAHRIIPKAPRSSRESRFGIEQTLQAMLEEVEVPV